MVAYADAQVASVDPNSPIALGQKPLLLNRFSRPRPETTCS